MHNQLPFDVNDGSGSPQQVDPAQSALHCPATFLLSDKSSNFPPKEDPKWNASLNQAKRQLEAAGLIPNR